MIKYYPFSEEIDAKIKRENKEAEEKAAIEKRKRFEYYAEREAKEAQETKSTQVDRLQQQDSSTPQQQQSWGQWVQEKITGYCPSK